MCLDASSLWHSKKIRAYMRLATPAFITSLRTTTQVVNDFDKLCLLSFRMGEQLLIILLLLFQSVTGLFIRAI